MEVEEAAAVAVAVAADEVVAAVVECVEAADLVVAAEYGEGVGFRWAEEVAAVADLVVAVALVAVEVGEVAGVGVDTAVGAAVDGGPTTGAELVTDGAQVGGLLIMTQRWLPFLQGIVP